MVLTGDGVEHRNVLKSYYYLYHRICLTINKIVYFQHLLVSFEELLSLRLSDPFALVVGCINNWECKHCGAGLGRHAPVSSMETKSRPFEEMPTISGYLPSNAPGDRSEGKARPREDENGGTAQGSNSSVSTLRIPFLVLVVFSVRSSILSKHCRKELSQSTATEIESGSSDANPPYLWLAFPIPQVKNSQTSGSNLQWHSDLEQPHRQGVRKVRPKSRDSTEVEKNVSLPRTSPHLCWHGTAHHGVCLPCMERRTSGQADSPSRIVLPA